MSSIIGVTVGTPVPQSDWNQTNPNRADYIKNKPDLDSMFGRTSSQINKLDKRVTNLEQGILPSPFVTDDGVAYQKSVPSNALPYAEVEKIGGMTRKCANLIPFPYANPSYEMNGITFTNNGDGSITVNGTATQQAYFILMSETSAYVNKTISASGGKSSQCQLVIINYGGDGNYYDSGQGVTATPIGDIGVWIVVSGGATVNNETIYPMLNEGSTALPYEPYFEGLRSASVTEVESVGANLIDFAETTTTASGYIFRGLFLPQRIKAGTYTFSFRAKNYTPTNQFQCTFLNSKGVIIADSKGVFINETCIFTFTITEEAVVAELYVNSTIGGTFYDFMLNRGSTALPYSPYFRNTLPIPSAVQAKNGINEDVYDFIEWREDGTIKNYECVGAVDMGMLDWLKGSPTNDGLSNTFYTRFFAMANRSPLLCSKFTQVVQTGMWEDITNGEMLSANDNYIVVATNHTDATAFKSAMAGVMLYYELANPIITDISNLITEDNYIGVESGGTITMVNEHQYAVPSSITYQVKGEA